MCKCRASLCNFIVWWLNFVIFKSRRAAFFLHSVVFSPLKIAGPPQNAAEAYPCFEVSGMTSQAQWQRLRLVHEVPQYTFTVEDNQYWYKRNIQNFVEWMFQMPYKLGSVVHNCNVGMYSDSRPIMSSLFNFTRNFSGNVRIFRILDQQVLRRCSGIMYSSACSTRGSRSWMIKFWQRSA